MNLFNRFAIRACLVSATLLAAWGCEDTGNLAGTDVTRTDAAADGPQTDQSGPAPEVLADSPADAPVPLVDAPPDVPSEADTPDAEVGRPIDSRDAGGDAPPDDMPDADGPSDGSRDESPDEAVEGPSAVGQATCPGSNCPLVIAPDHLQLWLRGDDIDCFFSSGVDRVRQWPDRSGKGNHARPASDQGGPLCGASANMLNGKGVVTFPRMGRPENVEHLEVSLASIQGRPFTVVIVEKRADAVDPGYWMLGGEMEDPYDQCSRTMAGVNAGRLLQIGYPVPWEKRADTWGQACGIVVDDTKANDAGLHDPSIPTVTTLWVVTLSPAKKLSLHLNGRTMARGDAQGDAEGEGLGPIGNKPPIKGFIGRGYQPLQADSRFKGDIAEILIFDVALDDGQRRTLEQHLQPRWGFAITN